MTSESRGSLLIVDDEAMAVRNLSRALGKDGYQVSTCQSGTAALEALKKQAFDVLLTDLRMAGIDGMALLQHCRAAHPETQVIMITGYATPDSAVAAMKAGAYHYLAKPLRLDEVREVTARAVERVRLQRENRELRRYIETLQGGVQIVTQDHAMQKLLDTAQRIAPTDCNVLVSGESGTGKELLARFVHTHSRRVQGPFFAINCGALHEELLANELFGHEKGAFTGAHSQKKGLIESAAGGSLFLDEIGETPPAMQVKLLRVIEQHELLRVGGNQPVAVDVRFIAATNRNLGESVKSGYFRHDLFFRLNVMELHLPPLARRDGDVPLLAYFFLKKYATLMEKPVTRISHEALRTLNRYAYPGNIRELSNLIERGVALAEAETLEPRHLPEHLCTLPVTVLRQPEQSLPTLEEYEAEYIRLVLERTAGNRTRAAEILGIDRVSLWRKLKRYQTLTGK